MVNFKDILKSPLVSTMIQESILERTHLDSLFYSNLLRRDDDEEFAATLRAMYSKKKRRRRKKRRGW